MENLNKNLATRKCEQRDRDFGWLFRNQYVLRQDADGYYPGWSKTEIGEGWTLNHGNAVRLNGISDNDGQKVGIILGYPVLPDGAIPKNGVTINSKRDDIDFADIASKQIADIAGQYLAVIITPNLKRLYGDPVQDIPALFDPNAKRVASSLGLLLEREMVSNPDFTLRNVLRGRQILGLGNTIDNAVNRMFSNHYLDLDTFDQLRFWPYQKANFEMSETHVSDAIDEMILRIRRNMKAFISTFDCILPVTGGRDSRMLLACGMDYLGDIKEFSGYRFHNASRIDCKRGTEIMRGLGYPYKHYFFKKSSGQQIRDMRLKMGWSGFRAELKALAMIEEYPQDRLILRGNIMELLRANQWRGDKIGKPLHRLHAIRRLGMPVRYNAEALERWGPEYMTWYDGLPDSMKSRAYDMAFVELFLPNTQGPYFLGHHRTPFINPFNDRKLIELAISIPPQLRHSNEIVPELIRRAHAPLLEIPFH